MPFDEAQYVQDFIKKLRGTRRLPDDLLPRYAITLPASDAEIAEQVKAVRAYWNKTYQGKTTAAQVSRMCRADDERLRAEHGPAMETRSWWEQRQSESRSAASASIGGLAQELRQRYGQLGVVTSGTVERFAAKLHLTEAESFQAVQQAELVIVNSISLPESEPIPNFQALVRDMTECGVNSVPELVHPGAGEFHLLGRYACRSDPGKRLDVAAVDRQITEADKRGVSATENARRAALKILRHALKEGVDLRDVALYHLVLIARDFVGLSHRMAAENLHKTGLSQEDAAVLVVTLDEQSSAAGAAGLAKVRSLLAAGRLSEAAQSAQGLAEEAGRAEALQDVAEARNQLNSLLAEAAAAHEASDDARAVALLRKAALISSEDAGTALAAIPLSPPVNLRAVSEGSSVRLFWKPGQGHDEGTTYTVSRTDQQPPAIAADGVVIHSGQATSYTDMQAPVARAMHYGVFASSDGRPDSQLVSTPLILLPPVTQLKADVGPTSIALHWSAHPSAHEVQVIWTPAGKQPTALPVTGNSALLDGLTEGQPQHFQVTAIYRNLDGNDCRSAAEHLDAIPRSEAKPLPQLRARPVNAEGTTRIRVSWTPVDHSEIQIRRSRTPPPWNLGARVSAQDMAHFGQELTGLRIHDRSEISLETDVPAGLHHLLPFSIGGTGIVVGAPTAVGVTEPVRHLAVTTFATHATVSWEWPPGIHLAEVIWETGSNHESTVIGAAQYRSNGGARIPLGTTPCTVEVRALIQADEMPFSSAPARAVIDKVIDIPVAYTVSGPPSIGPFGGRSKKLVFTAAQGCQDVQVRVVAAAGRVIPTTATAGVSLLDTSLTLAAGQAAEHHVTVPRSIKRPYWVRCFILAGRARLIDPPISDLKEP